MTIGFVGLGNMGGNIALRLLDQGHQLIVSDLSRDAAAEHLARGATWADSAADVATRVDVVLTSLPGPKQVEPVSREILSAFGDGSKKLLVELSTSSPGLASQLAAEFAAKGARFFDCPVSGSIDNGRNGTLNLLVGGDPADIDSVRPLLEDFSREIIHLGPAGAGLVGKLANNAMVMAELALFSEVISIGAASGIEPRALVNMLTKSSVGQGSVLKFLLPELVLQRKFSPPTFALDLGRKDIGLAVGQAKLYDVPTPLLALVEQSAVEMVAAGHGDEDSSVVYSLQERRSGRVIHDAPA